MNRERQLHAQISLNLVGGLLRRFENLLGKLIVAIVSRHRDTVRLNRFPVEPSVEPGDGRRISLRFGSILAGQAPVVVDLNSRWQVVGLQIERIGDFSGWTWRGVCGDQIDGFAAANGIKQLGAIYLFISGVREIEGNPGWIGWSRVLNAKRGFE